MNLWKKFIYLNRNDRQALLAILFVFIMGATVVFVVDQKEFTYDEKQNSHIDSTAPSITKQETAYYKDGIMVHELFAFDPNTASEKDFRRLGLEAWQAKSIIKYRKKGGIFRTPNDFARVYGLSKKQFETFLPYITISEDFQPAANFYPQERYSYSKENPTIQSQHPKDTVSYHYPQKIKEGQYIEINSADTTLLQKIPGIGKYYAKSIIRYREQLGGFCSVKQILEIEGISESVIKYMKLDDRYIKKLNINKLPISQLRRHPYLTFYQAKEICDYRRKFGPLNSIDDLKLLKEFPPAEIERLQPYVTF